MTKLRNIGSPDTQPPPRKGPGGAALGIALFGSLALGLGLGAFWGDDTPSSPLRQVALSFSNGWMSVSSRAPEVLTPLRLGDWPSWLLNSGQGTRNKSQIRDTRSSQPVIAIVIDDCGIDVARTREAIALPDEVTLSFLPYARASKELSHRAHLAGHEVIVHLPMQPEGSENPGPNALQVNLPPEELKQRLELALAGVSDYDGVNNHMGSRFTKSPQALAPVMKALASRKLFFLDSRTTAATQAESVARDAGLLTGSRDVFLDNDESAPAVERQLARAEREAKARGTAIVIGHPHPETLAALKSWTEHAEERGFRLAPLKAVLTMRARQEGSRTVSR